MNSIPELTTIGEMIDSAFGDPDKNVVHHKLIQTILYILARQLRMLDRKVKVELLANAEVYSSDSSLMVSEIKIQAGGGKKKRRGTRSSVAGGGRGGVGGPGGQGGRRGTVGTTGESGSGGQGGRRGTVGTTAEGGSGGPSGRRVTVGTTDEGGSGGQGGRRVIVGTTDEGRSGGGGGRADSKSLSRDEDSSGRPREISESRGSTTTNKRLLTTDSSGKTIDTTDQHKDISLKRTVEQFSPDDQPSTEKSSTEKSSTDKSSTEKSSTEKSSTDKSSTEKSSTLKSITEKTSSEMSMTELSPTEMTSTIKSSTQKSTTMKSSTDKTTTESPTERTSSFDQTITDITTDKSSTQKTSSSDKTSTDKTSTYKSSTDKSSTDKTSSDQTSTDKTSTDKTRTDKTSTDKTSSDKSSSDKTSSDKTSTDKTSTVKTSTDKTSTDKTSTDKTSTDKTSTDKTSTDKTSTDKTSTDKTSSDKTSTQISTDKTSSDKSSTLKTSTEKSTTEKTTTDKTTTSSSSKGTTISSTDKRAYHRPHREISAFEIQREQELRVIRQRTDSREEHDKTPTPMASMDSVEVQYEKLLVVERVSSKEAKARTGRLQGEVRGAAPRLSIVTQEEFSKLATVVRKLQEKFDPIGAANFPENIQLMQELRKGASLTDAMAALQLSARLEAAEKALQRMTGLVTELATNYPDVDLSNIPPEPGPRTEVLYQSASGRPSQARSAASRPSMQSPKAQKSKIKPGEATRDDISVELEETTYKGPEPAAPAPEEEKENPDWITTNELDVAMQELYDNIMNSINVMINKNKTNADAALKMASRLESKLNSSLDLGTRMTDLETLVASYTEKINTLDAGLSSQMTYYQEELTQMQHELESGLENMAEALANTGGDTAAVAELNGHFTNLQIDFETTNARQNELREIQVALKLNLEELRKEIEILREAKSDRDEVADALRDKVGLGTLNGLVALEQFDAVRGDFEQRIGAAYEKFNNQEIIWQKAIDDLWRTLDEKANWTQIMFLKEDIKMNIDKLQKRLKDMLDIVGEPQAAAVSKKLRRDTNCLSCSTPAHMHLEQATTVPALPAMPGKRPPTLGAESPPKLEEGVCYPGLPVKHDIDPRSHVCNRYCGGSHTKVPATLSRAPPSMTIKPAVPTAKTEEQIVRKPCIPCNVKPLVDKQPKEVKEENYPSSDMTPIDFQSMKMDDNIDSFVDTPPVPADEY